MVYALPGFGALELCLKGVQMEEVNVRVIDMLRLEMGPISALLRAAFGEDPHKGFESLVVLNPICTMPCSSAFGFVVILKALSPPCLVAGGVPTWTWLSSFAGLKTSPWAASSGPAQVK